MTDRKRAYSLSATCEERIVTNDEHASARLAKGREGLARSQLSVLACNFFELQP